MAEAYVENGLEFLAHATGKHFDHLYDKAVGKPKSLPPPLKEVKVKEKEHKSDSYDGPFRERRSRRNSESYDTFERGVFRSASTEAYTYSRSRTPAAIEARPRRHYNTLPYPELEIEPDLGRGHLLTERALRIQEQVLPPKKNLLLDKALPPKEDLILVYKSKSKPRRDSAMASGYRDDYRELSYRGENNRPRSQPPRGRYDDDEDSDYDERSGDRHRGGGGRGYDDRDDYDTVREVREVYRGPAANRPWAPERNESNRSDYSAGPYGAGAVAQYGRRSEGNVSRTEIARREKSRGRDSYDSRSRSRSRSYSRSRSRSRSRSGSGIRGKLEETFSTRPRGLGAGLAGAVIGGLAGREFGHKHKNRDIVIGAIVGGLAANAGENKWTEYKDGKEREPEREIMRYEGRSSYDGRSRSNVR